MRFGQFEDAVLDKERELLSQLRVRDRLTNVLSSRRGLSLFGRAFYFVRYAFYRHNFIVGSRSGPDETFWGGLVQNLLEELGGLHTPTHNMLYRQFLAAIGVRSERRLKEPTFAADFNRRWETFCKNAPFVRALAGIAVYEVLDVPDYALLLEVMKAAGVERKGLLFFEVHAEARHFDLFGDSMTRLWRYPKGRQALHTAASFVHRSQDHMWSGLLRYLEDKT